jgi:chemotaxis protein methyltransferase CheR
VTAELREPVVFRQLNLAHTPYPLRGPLDGIFCRNVMMYFDAELRRRLLAELRRLLKPGGLLLVGHAESLAGASGGFRTVRPSVYVKSEAA